MAAANGTTTTPRSASKTRAIGRITAPYLGAAIFAAAAMAWYLFIFVPGKLDYFVGLRFRTLAVASAQIKSKVENLSRALNAAVKPIDHQLIALPTPSLDDLNGYFSVLAGDIRLRSVDDSGLVENGLTLTVTTRDNKGIAATVAWDDVVRSASNVSGRDFDDLLLADSDGKVLWQRERTTARIGNLKELRGLLSESSGWFSPSWRLPKTTVKSPPEPLPGLASLTPVDIGGTSSYLFIQSIDVSPVMSGKPPTYLAGIVSWHQLQQQAMHVPIVWISWLALPIVLLMLALPLIKLVTLTPKERYSFLNVALLGLATLWALGIGAVLPFGAAVIDSSVDDTLAGLAQEIESRFADETSEVLDLSAAIQQRAPSLKLEPCLYPIGQHRNTASQRCELWQALAALKKETPQDPLLEKVGIGSLELDVVAWLDRDGAQLEKLSTKSVVTALVSHQSYAHFQNLVADHTWTLRDASDSRARNHTPFTIEPLRTPTTAEMGFVFAVRTEDRDTPYFVLNVKPQSVVDPVVPPGYGYAVLDERGDVMFHSEEALSLTENFFDEVNHGAEVRRYVTSGHEITWSSDYHGRPHRLYVRGMTEFAGSAWRIVTFQEVEAELEAQLRQHETILRMGVVNLLVLIGLAFVYWLYTLYKGRRLRDILLVRKTASVHGVAMLVLLTIFSVELFIRSYSTTANSNLDGLYVWFLLLPVLAIGIALLARTVTQDTSQSLGRPWRMTEVILLAILIGVAPGIGFARIACQLQDTKHTAHCLERIREQWEARRVRVLERVRSIAHSEQTQGLLLEGFARQWTTAQGSEPRYSYLGQVDRLKLYDGSARVSTRPLWTGQTVVRYVQTWAPLITKEDPGELAVTKSDGAFQLAPRTPTSGPVFTATIAGDIAGDLSIVRVVLGLAILVGGIWALCWARRKLTVPTFVAPQTFEDVMSTLPTTGTEVVLLIGPPRTSKDSTVRNHFKTKHLGKPFETIRLLDKQLTDATVNAESARIEELIRWRQMPRGTDGRVWIHLSNLEAQLTTAEARKQVLKLLEKLTDEYNTAVSRVVVVTSSVDPIANFQEIFNEERQDVYDDVVPEVELSRSSLLLSRCRRSYLPTRCDLSAEERWNGWLNYEPASWKRTLDVEAEGYQPLVEVNAGIPESAWPTSNPPSIDLLARAFTARAEAAYQLLWTSCTRSEKLVLVQLAQEGMVNPKCYEVVARLIAKGIVVTKPGLTVFNYSFRRFLRGIERGQVVSEWERSEGSGLWVSATRLVGSGLILGGVFFFLTQDFPVQSLLPVLSGTGLFGIPVIRDLTARLAGGRSSTPSQNA